MLGVISCLILSLPLNQSVIFNHLTQYQNCVKTLTFTACTSCNKKLHMNVCHWQLPLTHRSHDYLFWTLFLSEPFSFHTFSEWFARHAKKWKSGRYKITSNYRNEILNAIEYCYSIGAKQIKRKVFHHDTPRCMSGRLTCGRAVGPALRRPVLYPCPPAEPRRRSCCFSRVYRSRRLRTDGPCSGPAATSCASSYCTCCRRSSAGCSSCSGSGDRKQRYAQPASRRCHSQHRQCLQGRAACRTPLHWSSPPRTGIHQTDVREQSLWCRHHLPSLNP